MNMEHASYTQPASRTPVSIVDRSSADSLTPSSPKNNVTSSPFSPEISPTRQQRLLQNRNTRFPAKKLSISGISNKLTQLISNNEHAVETSTWFRDQENNRHHNRNNSTLGRKGGLSILEEISNTARNRSIRRRADIHIYQDTPERPLLQSSPYIASSPGLDTQHNFTSPLDFGRVSDSLDEMRTKTLSPSERWSTLASSPPESRSHLRKRSGHLSYDQEEYIKHLEDRLQQLEQDAYSPLTRRPMKEKLIAANKENERLYKELATLKEKFETEVKRTVEHKTAIEVELRKRVRDLEEALEEKEVRILELQYQHTENRLDSSTVETLKSTIERLEQDKLNMEQIHQSMTKRNETLTKLVASSMSPPKGGGLFDKTPQKHEKGNHRMSLILPKVPYSPSGFQQYSYSATASPVLMSSSDISPLKLSSSENGSCCFEDFDKSYFEPRSDASTSNEGSICSPALSKPVSRRSTMHVETSVSVGTRNNMNNSALEPRIHPKRKARRFLAGSTQLKPLLLPALTGEPVSLVSTPAMTALDFPQFESAFESSLEQDEDLTIIADPTYESLDHNSASDFEEHYSPVREGKIERNTGPAYTVRRDDSPSMQGGSPPNGFETPLDTNTPMPEIVLPDRLDQVSEQSVLGDDICALASLESQFWSNSSNLDPEDDSVHNLLASNTPDDMEVIPLPLFAPVHLHDAELNMLSRTLSESSQSPVKVLKKRQPLTSETRGLLLVDQPRPKLSPSIPDSMFSDRSYQCDYMTDRQVSRMKSGDNFVDFLRQKNFAAKPLTMVTIRTVYRILSACTSAVQDFQKNPFALARRVLANAWHMNWKVLGKLSWWVLGLFSHSETRPKTRPAIDWEQYDGASIADRCCNREEPMLVSEEALAIEQDNTSTETGSDPDHRHLHEPEGNMRPGILGSVLLWGKFSAAIMLAVGGAIIKGPDEMMKSATPQDDNLPDEERKLFHSKYERKSHCDGFRHRRPPRTPQKAPNPTSTITHVDGSTPFRLDSHSITEPVAISSSNQHGEADQQRSDLTDADCEKTPNSDIATDPFLRSDYPLAFALNQCVDQDLDTKSTERGKSLNPFRRVEATTKPFLLFDELSESSCTL